MQKEVESSIYGLEPQENYDLGWIEMAIKYKKISGQVLLILCCVSTFVSAMIWPLLSILLSDLVDGILNSDDKDGYTKLE